MTNEEIKRLRSLARRFRLEAENASAKYMPHVLVRVRAGLALDAMALSQAVDLAMVEVTRDTTLGPTRLRVMREWAEGQRPHIRRNIQEILAALEDCAYAAYAAKEAARLAEEELASAKVDIALERAQRLQLVADAARALNPGRP